MSSTVKLIIAWCAGLVTGVAVSLMYTSIPASGAPAPSAPVVQPESVMDAPLAHATGNPNAHLQAVRLAFSTPVYLDLGKLRLVNCTFGNFKIIASRREFYFSLLPTGAGIAYVDIPSGVGVSVDGMTPTAAAGRYWVSGDINCDGAVTEADAALVQQYHGS